MAMKISDMLWLAVILVYFLGIVLFSVPVGVPQEQQKEERGQEYCEDQVFHLLEECIKAESIRPDKCMNEGAINMLEWCAGKDKS